MSLLIKRVYHILLVSLFVTACLAAFFAKKWYEASKLDNVYILSSDHNAEVEEGIYFQVEPLVRSKRNPFGVQIRKLKFLHKKSS